MSCFGMRNGYHAVKVKSWDIPKTDFSTQKGHWEWFRMPMGLINSGSTYVRMINYKFRGLIGLIFLFILMILIVFGSTPEMHLRNLRIVFGRLRESHLALNPDKCCFLQKKLENLGHKVTPEGIKPLERNVEKVLNFQQPKNKREIEQFFGLASYYRKFIPNFARRIYNINRLKAKNVEFKFDENCVKKCNKVRKLLSEYPLVRHSDNSKPFILHVNASNKWIGGTFSLLDDNGAGHPCAYASRALNPAEQNYSTTEKELLAAVWTMKELKYFLYCQKFNLFTDLVDGILQQGPNEELTDTNRPRIIATENTNIQLNIPPGRNNYLISKNTYIWVNKQTLNHLLKDYAKNKSVCKNLLVSRA